MEAVWYSLFIITLYPYIINGEASINFRLEKLTFSSERDPIVACCDLKTIDSQECLSVCPYLLKLCFTSNERVMCTEIYSLDIVKEGVDITQIQPQYIQHGSNFYVQLFTADEVIIGIFEKNSTGIKTPSKRSSYAFLGKCERVNIPCSIHLSFDVRCDLGFYGDDCSVFCLPQDNCSGHFTCDSETGKRNCLLGWKGDSCNTKDDSHLSCSDSLCLNGGTCLPSSDNDREFTCCCAVGFTGVQCKYTLQSVNNNSITKNQHMFSMLRRNYKGQKLNIRLNKRNTRQLSSQAHECRNFGKHDKSGKCVCLPGFTGSLCETDILECANSPCIHGRCIEPNTPNNYTCICDAGFTGTNCDIPTTDNVTQSSSCPQPCYQNNSCSKQPIFQRQRPATSCPQDMYGENCSVHCVPQNNCGGGHFVCDPITGAKTCLLGWKGDRCTIRNVSKSCDPECPDIRCKNDGMCFNGTCCCLPNYTGTYCEREILNCIDDPCKNGATCSKNPSGYGYMCHCKDEYNGTNCEHMITTQSPSTKIPKTSTEAATSSIVTDNNTTKPTNPPPSSTVTTTTPSTSTSSTTSTTQSSTTLTTTTKPPATHEILIDGKINDKDIPQLEKLLNSSFKDLNCGSGAKIIGQQHLIDDNGNLLTKIIVASDCLHDGKLDPKVLETLNQLFQRTQPFRGNGNHIFGNHVSPLKDLAMSYSLNLIGYVYNQNEDTINRKITNVWKTANPNIPDIKVLIVLLEYLVGELGTRVTKLTYFVTSQFHLMDPRTVPAPSVSAFKLVFGQIPVVNHIYTGPNAYTYSAGIRLPLIDTSSQITSLVDPLLNVWKDFLKSHPSFDVPEGDLDIVMSGKEKCFSGNRSNLQSSVYFPVLKNGSMLTFDMGNMPDTSGVVTTSCQTCLLQRQFYVDLVDRIKLRDRDAVKQIIQNAWLTKRKGSQMSFTSEESFENSNGSMVTRLWYTHPIGPSDNYDVWPNPNIGGHWTNISQSLQAVGHTLNTFNVERLYLIVLKNNIEQSQTNRIGRILHTLWADTNRHVPGQDLQIHAKILGVHWYSKQGSPVTRVYYKVSVKGTDSSEVAVDVPGVTQTSAYFAQASYQLCNCIAFMERELGLSGNIGTDDKQILENSVKTAWENANQGLSVDVAVSVKDMLAGYETESGEKATKIIYYIVPSINGKVIEEDDLDQPDLSDIKTQVESDLPHTAVEIHPLVKSESEKDTDENSWLLPTAIGCGVAVLLLIIISIVACVKHQRHKASKNLNQNPERVEGYDKEHFSVAPDLDNSLNVDDPQWVEKNKHETYVVNM